MTMNGGNSKRNREKGRIREFGHLREEKGEKNEQPQALTLKNQTDEKRYTWKK